MAKLFIYYSCTGNVEEAAKRLQEKGYDLREAKRKKPLPKSFFFRVLSGGFLAGLNHKDKLLDFDPDISSYDEILIGSPIWNGRFCSPINTVLSVLNLDSKKVRFLFCSGSGEAPKALKRIQKEYPSADAVVLKEPKKHPEEWDKLEAFIIEGKKEHE